MGLDDTIQCVSPKFLCIGQADICHVTGYDRAQEQVGVLDVYVTHGYKPNASVSKATEET